MNSVIKTTEKQNNYLVEKYAALILILGHSLFRDVNSELRGTDNVQ